MGEEQKLTLVVGAGAIGRMLASVLGESQRVVLIDVDESLVKALTTDGVVVERENERRVSQLEVVSSIEGLPMAAMVFFCVKSYATEAAAKMISPVVDFDSTICSLQNGWGNGDVLASVFDPSHVVVGVTYNSATVRDGVVHHTGSGTTLVGPYEGSVERAEAVADALRHAGLEANSLEAVRPEIWKKLILNAATLPTAALSGLTTGGLGAFAPMLDLVDDLTREAVMVAVALGYEIDVDERIALIHQILERGGAGKASMLQDLEASRRTEVDVVCGAVARAAGEMKIDVPLTRAMYALVKGVEKAKGLT
jgi:2-dehydropantoate 2-reductase